MCDGCCTCDKRSKRLIAKAKTMGTVRVIQPGNSEYHQMVREHGRPPFIITPDGHHLDC